MVSLATERTVRHLRPQASRQSTSRELVTAIGSHLQHAVSPTNSPAVGAPAATSFSASIATLRVPRLTWLPRCPPCEARQRVLRRTFEILLRGALLCSSFRSFATDASAQAGFYVTLAAIPASIALYRFTRQGTDEQPFFTRVIVDTYNDYKEKWARRNDTHTRAMEQAAADRVLFLNASSQNPRTIDLRFPEYVFFASIPMSPNRSCVLP